MSLSFMIEEAEKQYCPVCRQNVPLDNFYHSYEKYHKNNRSWICKECSEEIASDIMGRTDSFEYNLRSMLSYFSMPYSIRAVKFFKDNFMDDKELYCRNYLHSLKMADTKPDSWDDLGGESYIAMELFPDVELDEEDLGVMQKLASDWGKQETLDDYIFLEEKRTSYSKGRKMSEAAKTTLKFLCLAELEVRKNREIGEDVSKAEQRVVNYFKQLNLSNFDMSEEKPIIEQTLENWAYIWEQTEPIDWIQEKYDDICRFREDNTEIMRCIGNKALNNKNYPNLTQEDIDSVKINKKPKQKYEKKKKEIEYDDSLEFKPKSIPKSTGKSKSAKEVKGFGKND